MIVSSLFVLSLLSPAPISKYSLDVGGQKREFWAAIPEKARVQSSPIIFAFHWHGGNGSAVAKRWKYESLWPGAVVLYPTGLPAPGIQDPKGQLNGWQKNEGELGDRDLKFFDALLTWAKSNAKIDGKRIFCMGHSNGAAFTYLLWAKHPGLFAAIAPAAGGFRPGLSLTPATCMVIAGKQDTLVPYENQLRTLERVKRINGCQGEAKPWATGCQTWKSSGGTPVVFYSYDGPHRFPEDTPSLVVKFFREHELK